MTFEHFQSVGKMIMVCYGICGKEIEQIEHCGMLWYFLEWSIESAPEGLHLGRLSQMVNRLLIWQ